MPPRYGFVIGGHEEHAKRRRHAGLPAGLVVRAFVEAEAPGEPSSGSGCPRTTASVARARTYASGALAPVITIAGTTIAPMSEVARLVSMKCAARQSGELAAPLTSAGRGRQCRSPSESQHGSGEPSTVSTSHEQ
jgi:hypothetical protein